MDGGGGDWVEGWGKLGGLQGGACGDMGVVHLPYTPVCQVERGEKDCLGLTLSPGETEREGKLDPRTCQCYLTNRVSSSQLASKTKSPLTWLAGGMVSAAVMLALPVPI